MSVVASTESAWLPNHTEQLATQYNNKVADFSAETEDIMAEPTIQEYWTVVRGALRPGNKVLGLGCGDGTDLKMMHEAGAVVFGIDSSVSMVDLVKQKVSAATAKEARFEAVPFDSSSFDSG